MPSASFPLLLLLTCALAPRAGAIPGICRGILCYSTFSHEGSRRLCSGAHCQATSATPSRDNSGQIRDRGSWAWRDYHRNRSIAEPSIIQHAVRRKDKAVDGERDVPCPRAASDCPRGRANHNGPKGCKGLECRLPLRIRLKPKRRAQCTGEHCPPGAVPLRAEALGQPSLIQVRDTAAQDIGDIPDLGYSTAELGAAALGIQLSCDIKPG